MFTYGDVIKVCRQTAGLTQRELAERTHLSIPQLSTYELNKVVPRVDILDSILDACGYELGIREKKQVYTEKDVAEFMEKNR